jgi:hypothetical protein
MNITKTKANNIINECFSAIPLIHINFSDIKTKLFKMCLDAEKEHRHGRTISNFSSNQAAKYFTVKYLFDGLSDPEIYDITAIIHYRLECLYGHAYAIEYKDKLQEFKTFVESSGFSEVDYSDMMKDHSHGI